ncbi:MAG TPA: hypothetical protein VFX49_01430, partial [Chloroflexota bacterium]|nr:hypothetical protein [Chloroflexota bacterium]
RLKALKRQMFGRARFDLLRIRFLHSDPIPTPTTDPTARSPPTSCQSHFHLAIDSPSARENDASH